MPLYDTPTALREHASHLGLVTEESRSHGGHGWTYDAEVLLLLNAAREIEDLRTAVTRELRADKERLDWLQAEVTDTIYLDDGRIIDVRGLSVRAAIDDARKAAP